MKIVLSLFFMLPFAAIADCTITWGAPISSDNVTQTRIYHDPDGSGFALAGSAIAQPSNQATCDGQGITAPYTGHIGATFVNASGESEMTTAAFPPQFPGKPINLLISITP